MNIIDIGLILILIMSFLAGWKNGVIKESVSFIGLVIVFIISYCLKGIIGNFLCIICPFFQFSGSLEGLTTLNIFLYQAVAFLLMFSILSIIYVIAIKLSKFLQKIVNLTIILLLPSKILGGLVSLIKTWIILFVILFVCMIPLGNIRFFQESKITNQVLYHTPIVRKMTSPFMNAFLEAYELNDQILRKDISTNDANLRMIDIMLKYKVVNKSTIESLIKLKKIDTIQNIENILNEYE